ncbi:AGE family epimerase/isomerase [Haloarchaeobius sp. DFWS5]|uniref:AGE family epimerase/isomerase n=1 Tax=Haloarchaeobius sp. DFWS5 TaxID=3446114 RepID=UPI003EB9B907
MFTTDHAPFQDPRWLHQHATNLLNFSYPASIDHTHGGYVAQLRDDDGTVYDARSRHLVATCRLVFNYSVGHILGGPDWCRSAAEHGLQFLETAHYDPETGGYAWLLDGREVVDDTRSTYGHAFVLLAYATAARAGIPGARARIEPTVETIVEQFWEPAHGLCRSNLDAEWEPLSTYRGQNANMHMCEAYLAAYEATGESAYLSRAYEIAESLARELTDRGDGLLWEHYTEDWEFDYAYNRDDPGDLFRPWGYQPGHLLEWSKLLGLLARHREEDWLLSRGEQFFEAAVESGWDDEYGGFVYNFDRDGEPVVEDKYYWPLAEGIGAAVVLGTATGDSKYGEWYDDIWSYAWDNVVNTKYGNWYFKLTRENAVHEALDPTPKVTVGYHQLANIELALDAARQS